MPSTVRFPNAVKLSCPRVHEALPRPRLFALLDAQRQRHKVIWIVAPPGSGKTTLAASYLSHIAQLPLWYQMDNADADPATLFFYLAQMLGPAGTHLPWLAPELSGDLPRFSRMFFREFFARVPPGSVLVLDNIHEFECANAGQFLEIVFSEIQHGVTLLALSRDAPPARLARFELDGSMSTLAWETLRFDRAEVRALAQCSDDGDETAHAWFDRVDGWAAGVVMMRDHMARCAGDPSLPALEGHDAIFRYFAGEILERMSACTQRQLLMLSCLPAMSARDAEQLTGEAATSALLDELYRKRLFIDRRGGAVPTYHFHALFREFLQREARVRLDTRERMALLERAAIILDGEGRTEEAMQLYRDSGAFPALVKLLLANADPMMGAGRAQSWLHWLSWLPHDVVEANPRLWYWQGCFLNPVDPQRAMNLLLRAESAFAISADVQARLEAIAAIIDNSYFQFGWRDFSNMRQWIDAMQAGIEALDLDALAPAAALRIHSRLVMALISTGHPPDHAQFKLAVERTVAATRRIEDPTSLLEASAILLLASHWIEIDPDIDSAMMAMLYTHLEDSSINPYTRVNANQWGAVRLINLEGDLLQAKRLLDFNHSLAEHFALHKWRLNATYFNTLINLNLRDLGEAAIWLEQARIGMAPVTLYKSSRVAMLAAEFQRQQGDADGALQMLLDGFELGIENNGTSALERSRFERIIAGNYALLGDMDTAALWSARAIEHGFGVDLAISIDARDFLKAYAYALKDERASAADVLRPALARHRRGRHHGLFVRLPQLASAIAALALSEDIEVEHVRKIIKRQCLQAPERYVPNWPWPVAVRTLGSFALTLNGEKVAASGKTQQRPLLLLKALLGTGEGGRTLSALMSVLWSNVEGPKSALNAAIHRLRKLLHDDEAVLVAGGKVSLNKLHVWSDVGALDALCDRIDRLPDPAPIDLVKAIAAELLDLYRGPFCDGDDDMALLATRDRCRSRFLSGATQLGLRLESLRHWPLANDLYARALEAEPLAEAIYRGLMRCAHAQHDPAAAFAIFRRCRDALSIVLNQKPSNETEELALSLGLIKDGFAS